MARSEHAHAAGETQALVQALPANDLWGVEAARLLITHAIQAGFSDLHLMCNRGDAIVRGRLDGELVDVAPIPEARRDLLIARLKVLARVPAFVRHEPQDGRIEWSIDGLASPLILRASFLPTIHGESAVIRFPEAPGASLELSQLGMSAPVLRETQRLLTRQEGTVLLTGPSGSGKTTTLYAMLRHLHGMHGNRRHFVTIENPVECDLGFATQVQVNEAQGVTFARALRASLRQDPNVLLIGEIRDAETACICVQAGMTGNLVFSTLHAGRVERVIHRLISTGVERWLVAGALTGLYAQRLARRACPACTGTGPPGCDACGWTGVRGRVGLFECAPVNEDVRSAVLVGAAPGELAEQVLRARVGSITEEARRLAGEGTIAPAERDAILAMEEDGP